MSNYNNSNNNLNNNNLNVSDLKYEFMKLKRNELLGLMNNNTPSCESNYKKLTLNSDSFFNNLYLLLTGYSASLVVVNLISNNVLQVYTNLFVLVLLLFNNNLISLLYKLFAVFLLFLVKLLFFLSSKNKCNNKLNNTLFLVYVILLNFLFLLNFIANRYNLNNSDVSTRNRNRVSKVVKVFNTSELYAYLIGNLVFLSVFYFVVRVYTLSYTLLIILVFLLLSRYRLSDLYKYKNFKEKSRKSHGKNFNKNEVNELNYFPVVQNLITAILLILVLFVIVFTLSPNNILYVNNYLFVNKYITANNYSKVRFLNKVKFLVVYTFFVLLLLLVMVVMYLFYFFTKFNSFLNNVLYNNYYLFVTVGGYDYNGAVRRLFLKNTSNNNTNNYNGETFRDNYYELNNSSDRKLKVYLYYVDVHDKLVKVKPLWTKFVDPKNCDNSDYVNSKLNMLYSKLIDKKNKLVQSNNEGMNDNYFMKRLSTKFTNKYLSFGSNEHSNQEENQCVNQLLPLYEKHNSSVGCSYHYTNTFANTYMESFNNLLNDYNSDSANPHMGELFYFLQRYVLLNQNEPSQFCLLSFYNANNKVRTTNAYYNQKYLGLKYKLLQYIHEFNCYLFLYNKDLEKQGAAESVPAATAAKETDKNNKLEQRSNDSNKESSNNKSDANDCSTKQKLMQEEKEEKLVNNNNMEENKVEQQVLLSDKKEVNNNVLESNEVYRLSIPSEYLNDTNRTNVTNKTNNTETNFLNKDYSSQRQRETQRNLEMQQLFNSNRNNYNLLQEKLLLENKEEKEENPNDYNNTVENFNNNLLKEQHNLLEDENNKLTERRAAQQEATATHHLQEVEQQENKMNRDETNQNNDNLDNEAAVDENKNEYAVASAGLASLTSRTPRDKVEEEDKEDQRLEENMNKDESNGKHNNKNKNKEPKSNKKKKTKYLSKLFNLKHTDTNESKNEDNDLNKKEKKDKTDRNKKDNENKDNNKEDVDNNEVKQNTYEHEYVLNTSNSYTKLFSNSYNKQESSQLDNNNNKMKKLKLSTNYVNNYSYNMNFNQYLNKTARPNTVNKHDSSGTNLLTPTAPYSSETRDKSESQQSNYYVGHDKEDDGLTFRREDQFQDNQQSLLSQQPEDSEQENKQDEEKVNSIMNDLMKDLNLEF